MSFKVLVWTSNDVRGASNALRFPSKLEAEAYASDLFYRWTAAEKTEVVECEDPINYGWDFVDNRIVAIPTGIEESK